VPDPGGLSAIEDQVLERLGAQRYLDPKLMATILTLRQRVLDEWAINTAAETMLGRC
jgi:hypothetical protein